VYQQETYEPETYQIDKVDLDEQITEVVRDKIGPEDIPEWIGGVYSEVMGHMAQNGVQPIGPPFAMYLLMNGAFEVEAGFPVATALPAAGRMETSRLPGGPAAMTTHLGPYETLPEAYQALEKWVDGHGYEKKGPFWETYFTDPNEEPDVTKWRTQVVMPIRPKG
jgi:effector-binding domain-containing protein